MLNDRELELARVKSEFTVSEASLNWLDVGGNDRLLLMDILDYPELFSVGIDGPRWNPYKPSLAEMLEEFKELSPEDEHRLGDLYSEASHLREIINTGCHTSDYFGDPYGPPTDKIVSREELTILASKLEEELPRFLASSKVDKKEPPIQALPDSLDPSTSRRLNAMIKAAKRFWGGVKEGSEDLPLNKTISAWIEDEAAVSTTLAGKMASIIRPDWAKNRTWKETKKR